MSSGMRHGKPEEELFLQRPFNADSPTVQPLRINKRDSHSPELAQPPAFPLPPGASSSPAPLPYPDDRDRTQRPINGRAPQVGFSDHTNTIGQSRPSPAPTLSSPPPSTAPVDLNNQGRSEYPAALRPREGRDGQYPQPTSRLAERRGNIPKPLPDSPGPEAPDKEGLFQRLPQRDGASGAEPGKPSAENNPYPEYYQQYWPPPGDNSSAAPIPVSELRVPNPGSVNRISSTASTSTTRAQRGSPPPPESPIIAPGEQPGGGIEARYAAAGIAGTSTLTSLQAQNAAAAQRAQQYSAQQARRPTPGAQQQQEPPRRPWTPTEQPGTQPHGPPTVYQGPSQATSPPPVVHAPTPQGRIGSPPVQAGRGSAPNALEHDFQRMHVSASPPPAYTPSGPATTTAQGYPNEKQSHSTSAGMSTPAVVATSNAANQGHPAFANDDRQPNDPSQIGRAHV